MAKTLFSFLNKNRASRLIATVFIVLFIFPQVSLGVWWNPFSWDLFNNNKAKNSNQLIKVQQSGGGVEQPKQKVIITKKITTTTTKVKDLISDTKMVSTTTQPVVNIVAETTTTSLAKNAEITSTTTTKLTSTLEQEKNIQAQNLSKVKLALARLQSNLAKQRLDRSATWADKNQDQESVKLIRQFLDNPSFANLKDFCLKAKDVKGKDTKQVLNEERSGMISISKTLYEELTWCYSVINESSNSISFVKYDPSFLIPLTDQNDSDKIRTLQIKYNDAIIKAKDYAIFGYTNHFIDGPKNPRNEAETIIESMKTSESKVIKSANTGMAYSALLNIIIPEVELEKYLK